MTLRIERVKGRIRLSGEFRIAQLDQVKTEIECCEAPVVLDLEELVLIDLEGVRFLNACEAKGISVRQKFGRSSLTVRRRNGLLTPALPRRPLFQRAAPVLQRALAR